MATPNPHPSTWHGDVRVRQLAVRNTLLIQRPNHDWTELSVDEDGKLYVDGVEVGAGVAVGGFDTIVRFDSEDAENYRAGQPVAFDGSTYVALQDAPEGEPDSSEDYALLFAKGDPGEPGETGPQGEKGDKGDTGETGPQGEIGDTGETGPQGETGPAGSISRAITLAVGGDTSDLLAGDAITYQGGIYEVLTDAPTGYPSLPGNPAINTDYRELVRAGTNGIDAPRPVYGYAETGPRGPFTLEPEETVAIFVPVAAEYQYPVMGDFDIRDRGDRPRAIFLVEPGVYRFDLSVAAECAGLVSATLSLYEGYWGPWHRRQDAASEDLLEPTTVNVDLHRVVEISEGTFFFPRVEFEFVSDEGYASISNLSVSAQKLADLPED
jgi:hypothetical protein